MGRKAPGSAWDEPLTRERLTRSTVELVAGDVKSKFKTSRRQLRGPLPNIAATSAGPIVRQRCDQSCYDEICARSTCSGGPSLMSFPIGEFCLRIGPASHARLPRGFLVSMHGLHELTSDCRRIMARASARTGWCLRCASSHPVL